MDKNWTYYLERAMAFLATGILWYTLYFKFTAEPTSVALFTDLGAEPWGRIGTGVLELVAGGLLLFRKTSYHGALLAFGLMVGAILSHLAILGVKYQGDYSLFIMACIVLLASIIILLLRKEDIKKFIADAKAST